MDQRASQLFDLFQQIIHKYLFVAFLLSIPLVEAEKLIVEYFIYLFKNESIPLNISTIQINLFQKLVVLSL